MWIGSLAIWVIPAVWWPLIFAHVGVLDIIYGAWLQYIVSNVVPLHYLVTLSMFIVASTKLVEIEGSPGVKAIGKKEVTIASVVYGIIAFADWLLVLFLGKGAIMYADHVVLDEDEWEEPGYLVPSIFD